MHDDFGSSFVATLADPVNVGRFFAGHSSTIDSDEVKYWVVGLELGYELLMRMDTTGKDAFLALVEGCVERACIPTLTSEFVTTVQQLLQFSKSPATAARDNHAFFNCLEPIFYNGTRVTSDPDELARVDIEDLFERGREYKVWRSLARATFQMFFGTNTGVHTVTVAGPSTSSGTTSFTDTLTIYGFMPNLLVVGTSGSASGSMVGSVGPFDVEETASVSMGTRCWGTADIVWMPTGGQEARGTPFAANGAWGYSYEPKQIRSLVETLFRSVVSQSIQLFSPSESRIDMVTAIALPTTSGSRVLKKIIDDDTKRNPWTRPTSWGTGTVATLAQGVNGVTVRRSQTAYGTIQQMLALMRCSVARFPVHTMFTHTTSIRIYKWVVEAITDQTTGRPTGQYSVTPLAREDTTETSVEDGVDMQRRRILGSYAVVVDADIRIPKDTPADWTSDKLWIIHNPMSWQTIGGERVYVASTTSFPDDPGTLTDTMWLRCDVGASSSTIRQQHLIKTCDMTSHECFAQEVWPVGLDYVGQRVLTCVEKFADGMPLYDLYGNETRTVTGTRARISSWHGASTWAGDADTMAATWNSFDVQPTWPDTASLDVSAIKNGLATARSTLLANVTGLTVWYKYNVNCWTGNHGITWYAPYALRWLNPETGSYESLVFELNADGDAFVAPVPPALDSTTVPDPWLDDAVSFHESYKITHSDALGSVEWNFQAVPNTPSTTI